MSNCVNEITDFPIIPLLPRLIDLFAGNRVVILTAPPGSGKTTQVPTALLDAPWLGGKKILMLEPRRLAARAAAARMAAQFGERVGERVGYRIRFDRLTSVRTRIEVLTEGVLTRWIQNDPGLTGVGLVIFDEFHTRSLHTDVGLALCIELMQLRDDLKLLVMSATLDTEPLSVLLDHAPVLRGEGRQYPVVVHYVDLGNEGGIPRLVARGIQQVVQARDGSILAFLPGSGEIRKTKRLLEAIIPQGIEIQTLFGDMDKQAQDRVLDPMQAGSRRIVLATDLAETSLTLPGVSIVIDGGYCRRPKFYPEMGLTRLETLRISKAAAEQRAGRAGRQGPGECYRLWSPWIQKGLPEFTPPHIVEADLSAVLLELALWGVESMEAMSWLDLPPTGAINQGWELLQRLGAVDASRRLTAKGRRMVSLPLPPRLAHMVECAGSDEEKGLAADLAALLTESDPLFYTSSPSVDIHDRLHCLEAVRQARRAGIGHCDRAVLATVERVAARLRQLVGLTGDQCAAGDAGLLLAWAFPDRIGKRRSGHHYRYVLSGGRGAVLKESDPLCTEKWIVAAQLDAGQGESRINLACGLDEGHLRDGLQFLLQTKNEVVWNHDQGRVVARRVESLGAVSILERPWTDPDPSVVRAVVMGAVRSMGPQCCNWDRDARSLQARVLLARKLEPDENWPDMHDDFLWCTLPDWLEPFLDGITRKEQLFRLDVGVMLRARMNWRQQQRLDEGVPVHYQVPGGMRVRIGYDLDADPVLAVRIQQLFGVDKTPTTGWGRVPLVVHLLSPAGRPVQITRDLGNFWRETWPEVRRELSGRYPKHRWPEDPRTVGPDTGQRTRPQK